MEMAARKMKNHALTIYSITSLIIITIPLLHIIATTIINGVQSFTLEFFTSLPRPPGEEGGGIANAIQGTAILISLTMLFSIPPSLLTAIFLSEFPDSRFKNLIRLFNDTFMGTPSIVAGVFAYTLFVTKFGFSAIAGAFALSVLAIPMMVKTMEEAFKLVPIDIREAGLSLGIRHWKVVTGIVLRSAMPAIASGILLALARISGETAPLLFTAFGNPDFAGSVTEPVSALPLMIYVYATSPYPDWNRKAWSASLILMIAVLAINLITKYRLRRR